MSEPLIPPHLLVEAFPVSPKIKTSIQKAREIIGNIIKGKDRRLLVVVGPCSIHDIDAALEYADLLKGAAVQFAEDLFIVMRSYFEKPRTTTGWRGLICDPHLDGSYHVQDGLKLARKLLIALSELEIPAGTEFLDLMTHQYLSDLISWAAIGARTSASQIHRELASGLAMPVGFKNTVDGNIQVAVDAVYTAQFSHRYLGINHQGIPSTIHTSGNPFSHVILRGSNKKTNYSTYFINHTTKKLISASLSPHLMVDCSHGNCLKNYKSQMTVVNSITQQIMEGSSAIRGIMIESHLKEGNQAFLPKANLHYGQSITDGCLSWIKTLPLLEKLAWASRKRQQSNQK